MGKILETFLNGDLNLDGNRTLECQRLCEKGSELQEQLKVKLNSKENKILDRLIDSIMDEGTCYAQDRFARGYQLGMLMTMEVFYGQDTFLNRGV